MKKHRRQQAALFVALLLCCTLLHACSQTKYVMSVDGEKVPLDEFVYNLKRLSDTYSQIIPSGSDYWKSEEFKNALKQEAEHQSLFDRAVLGKSAELGVSITDDEKKSIREYRKEYIKSLGGTAAYEAELKKNGLNDRLYLRLSEISILYGKLYEKMYAEGGAYAISEEKIKEGFGQNAATVKHLYIKTINDDYTPLNDTAIEEKRKLAEGLVADISAGADFDKLIGQYGEEPLMADNPSGYSFILGDLSDSTLETAVFELEDNAFSELIESAYGFHIVQRLAVSEEYISQNRARMADALSTENFYAILEEDVGAMTVVYLDEYSQISIDNLNLYLS